MREIINEIWYALKEYVFKKRWFQFSLLGILILMGFVLVKALILTPVKEGEIGNPSIWEDYESLASAFTDTSKSLDGIEAEDTGKEGADEINPDSREIETVINQFFTTANIGNSDLFTSSFTPEQLDEDFFEYSFTERFKKIEEAMQGISRNGQLDRVEVVNSYGMIGSDSVRVVLDIHYKDLSKPVRINVVVTILEQNQFNQSEGDTIELPYIDSSVWKLIEKIKEVGE